MAISGHKRGASEVLSNSFPTSTASQSLSAMDEAAVDAAVAVTLLMVASDMDDVRIIAQALQRESLSDLNATISAVLASHGISNSSNLSDNAKDNTKNKDINGISSRLKSSSRDSMDSSSDQGGGTGTRSRSR